MVGVSLDVGSDMAFAGAWWIPENRALGTTRNRAERFNASTPHFEKCGWERRRGVGCRLYQDGDGEGIVKETLGGSERGSGVRR